MQRFKIDKLLYFIESDVASYKFSFFPSFLDQPLWYVLTIKMEQFIIYEILQKRLNLRKTKEKAE